MRLSECPPDDAYKVGATGPLYATENRLITYANSGASCAYESFAFRMKYIADSQGSKQIVMKGIFTRHTNAWTQGTKQWSWHIRSDLEFILQQIKIVRKLTPTASRCSARERPDPDLQPVLGACAPGTAPTTTRFIPEWGAADNEFPENIRTQYKTIMVPAGPGLSPASSPVSYTPGVDNDGPGTAGPSDVFDPYVRSDLNLIVDQTLGNPSAILDRPCSARASWRPQTR